MAIFQGIGSKPVKKSAGNLTYRYFNGRTVVSQKRTGSVKSKEAARGAAGAAGTYNTRVALFRCFQIFANAHLSAIKAAFNPSKSGNYVNDFIKVNYKALGLAWKQAVISMYNGTAVVTLEMLEAQLTAYVTAPGGAPIPVYRAKRTGFVEEFLTAAWEDTIVLTPLDTYQEIVSISSASSTGAWSVSKDVPAMISGANLSNLILHKTEDSTAVTLRISPKKYYVLDWATLTAIGGITTDEETAGIVNFGAIDNGYTSEVIWQVNP